MDALRSAGTAVADYWRPNRPGSGTQPGPPRCARSDKNMRTVTPKNLGILCAKLEAAKRQVR